MSKFREFMQQKYKEAEERAEGVSSAQEHIAEDVWNAAIELAIKECDHSFSGTTDRIALRKLLTYSEG